MSVTYTRMKCPYCGKQISTSGGGVHHYRKHVREGILEEYRDETVKYGQIRFAVVKDKRAAQLRQAKEES